MKYIILLIIAVSSFFASSASAMGWRSLVVDLRDGDPFVIDLSETLALELRDGSVVISDERTEFEFDRQDIISFSHRSTPFNISTGTQQILDSANTQSLVLDGENVRFSGFDKENIAEIFSLSGQRMASINFDSELTLSLEYIRSLAGASESGLLILTAGRVSMKINVRP